MQDQSTKLYRPVKRLTATEALARLADRNVVDTFTEDDLVGMASALGTGMEVFDIEDVWHFQEWAKDLLVRAACLSMVLEGRLSVRMTTEDDEPEFLLNRYDSRVPRGNIAQRDAITGTL